MHAAAAFIASLSSSGLGLSNNRHLQQAVVAYNSKVSLHHTITAESALASPTPQRELSSRIYENQFKSLLEASSPANKHWRSLVSYPDPDFHSCADGLHHRYVKSGSGKVLYSFLSSDYIIRREECIMMPYMEWRESVDT